MPLDISAAHKVAKASWRDSPILGMAIAAVAFFFLSLMSLFGKLLSDSYNIAEIAFWRNLIAVMPFFALIVFFGRRDILKVKSRPGVLVARSVIGTVNLIFLFGAFWLLPMADATALTFTSALFVPMLGFFFLAEKVGPYRWSAILIGFIGVLIIAQPTGNWNFGGVAFAITGAFFQAVLAIMLRLLGRTEGAETMAFYLLLTGVLLLAPLMPFLGHVPSPDDIWLLLGLGLSGAMMQFVIAVAYIHTPAALASLFTYTQIIWATIFGWVIFGQWPGKNIWLGAGIIILASLIVILREQFLARKGVLPRQPAGG